MSLLGTSVCAQHASDNPVSKADDAYGLTLGLESVGLYNPGLVRGYNPQAAGNVRLDGLYFDQAGPLSNRVLEGSTIRVGVSEIGYAFPAPTGIVDYSLRNATSDKPGATVITSDGPYEAWGVSVDGSVPVLGKELVVPIGIGAQLSTQQPYGAYPGYTSRILSAGLTPLWTPNDRITVRVMVDWQRTSDAKAFPFYFTAGDYRPPMISTGYLGQDWAKGRSTVINLGGVVTAKLSDAWSIKAGLFRSTNDAPVSFADLYTGIQPNGTADHVVVGFPDQNTASNSGEVRLKGAFKEGDWRETVTFMVRGRDARASYGGEDVVDEGPAQLGHFVQTPEPAFTYAARANDRTSMWSFGAAYHATWKGRAELEAGAQKEYYRETVDGPTTPGSAVSASPVRLYGNAAFAISRRWTVYGGYTQGLEGSGVAPSFAANRGAVLPASLTWQVDTGMRYAITPRLKVIAGVFELQKPYFNLDAANADRELGVQKATGAELSVAGSVFEYIDLNIGALYGTVRITGPDLAAEHVGAAAVGQPRLTYVANASYTVPSWPAASVDATAIHFGTAPESVDNRVYVPAATQVNLGGRYRFVAFGKNNALRLQVQNVMGEREWSTLFTPGYFLWPAPRTVFLYLTTDLQR